MLMSVGSMTSSIPVIELTVVPPSLMASLAMCECASMMPGDTNCPVVSMTSAPAGTGTLAPTAAILPSRRIDGAVRNRAPRDGEHRAAAKCDDPGLRGLAGLALDPDGGERCQNEQSSKGQKYFAADQENLQVKA